ncbi:MAG: DUF2059 domain-containing protein [Roseinatronobacter sp.]|nr:DUF2059 domain-containing protein [Roseinatronobacter sp.]
MLRSFAQPPAALLVALLLALLPMRPAAADDLARAYLLPELFEIMAEEGLQSVMADGVTTLEGRALTQFQRDVTQIYQAERMEADFTARLRAELETQPDVVQDALDFAQTDLGRKILRLEISARKALLDPEVDDIARMALSDARGARASESAARRLDLVRARIEANDLVELNVSLGLNTSYAYYAGMMAEDAANELSAEQVLYLVWAQESSIRLEVEDWSESYFLMAYAPLSEEEMQAYVAYVSTPLAQAFNRALFRAFDAVFTDISKSVGRALGRRLSAEEL